MMYMLKLAAKNKHIQVQSIYDTIIMSLYSI